MKYEAGEYFMWINEWLRIKEVCIIKEVRNVNGVKSIVVNLAFEPSTYDAEFDVEWIENEVYSLGFDGAAVRLIYGPKEDEERNWV